MIKHYLLSKRILFVILFIIIDLFCIYYLSWYFDYEEEWLNTYTLYSAINSILNGFIILFVIYAFYELGKYYSDKETIDFLKRQTSDTQEKIIEYQKRKEDFYQSLYKQQNRMIEIIDSDKDLSLEFQTLDHLIQQESFLFSNNKIIDVILTVKSQEMKEKNIRFKYDIHILESMLFQDIDLSTLLFNLLDNSINANENVDNGIIQLKMNYEYGVLQLILENTYGIQNEKEGNHGFGLHIIQDIVRKYTGEIKKSQNQEKYCIEIYLYEGEQ